jgi:hypothetical protein
MFRERFDLSIYNKFVRSFALPLLDLLIFKIGLCFTNVATGVASVLGIFHGNGVSTAVWTETIFKTAIPLFLCLVCFHTPLYAK